MSHDAPADLRARRALSGTDRWLEWRNRLLSHPKFQRWAAAFPLTRWIARRRANALFDLCAGFVYSQVLLACVRLGVFPLLAAGPLSVAELAARTGLDEDATLRLCEAAAALKLLERRRSARFGLGVHGAALLGNPAISLMVEHHALVYRDLSDPVSLLRGDAPDTSLSRFWTYAAGPAPGSDDVGPYSSLMSGSQALIAEDILEAYRFEQHQRLLDIGGGEGGFVASVAAHAPGLALSLFDLPPVAARAQAALERRGLAGRVTIHGGDVLRDPLPHGADVITLIRVVHDHDDEAALQILRAARAALASHGRLVIAEPMMGTRGAEPVGAYFVFYLLAMGQGRPRTPAALAYLLRRAGFNAPRRVRTRRPMLTELLVAEPDPKGKPVIFD